MFLREKEMFLIFRLTNNLMIHDGVKSQRSEPILAQE